MDQKEIEGIYKWFHLFFDGYESIDFFTLNHDLLLESLMAKIIDKSFSDGFSRNQKVLKSSGGEPLKLFQGEFPEPISILKLHGSIDIYRYVVAEQKGGIMTPTGEYLFFKTNDYYEKQRPERYDPETEEKVQTFHWEIDPQFITGTRKKDILNKPGIYKDLFNEFKKRIMECQKLIVFGYSFGDEHVNEIIQLAFRKSRRLRKVINVNPSKELPFDKMNCIVCNLKNSTELNGSLNISFVNQMKEFIKTIWFLLIKTFIRR